MGTKTQGDRRHTPGGGCGERPLATPELGLATMYMKTQEQLCSPKTMESIILVASRGLTEIKVFRTAAIEKEKYCEK